MSTNIKILETQQVEPNNVELGKTTHRNVGGFEYKEIPITYKSRDLVIATPNLFTFGIKKDDKINYKSYSIGLRIVENGAKKREFLKMLQAVAKECGKDKMVGSHLKFLYKPSTVGLTNDYYNLYARVPKNCDLQEIVDGNQERIRPEDLVGRPARICCFLRFRCVTISSAGSTLKVDLLAAIAKEAEVPSLDIISSSYLATHPPNLDSSDDESEEEEQ